MTSKIVVCLNLVGLCAILIMLIRAKQKQSNKDMKKLKTETYKNAFYRLEKNFRLSNFVSIRSLLLLAIIGLIVGGAINGNRLINAQSLQDKINTLSEQNKNNRSAVEKLKDVATNYQEAIHILEHDIAETEEGLRVSIERQHKIEADIVTAEQELEAQKGLLGKNIRAMYIEGDMSTIEMLASSNNISEYVDKQQYRQAVKNKIAATMAKIEELKKQLEEQKNQVKAEIEQQKISRAELASARKEQSRLLALNQNEQAEFNKQTKANEAKIAQLKEEQAELARRIASGSYVSMGKINQGDIVGRVGNTGFSTGAHLHLEARNSSGNDINPNNYIGNKWIRPVVGGYISQGYGVANNWYHKGYHTGIDFAGVTGAPVRAVADGEIVWRGCKSSCSASYGNYVMIRHYDGLYSLYAHLAL